MLKCDAQIKLFLSDSLYPGGTLILAGKSVSLSTIKSIGAQYTRPVGLRPCESKTHASRYTVETLSTIPYSLDSKPIPAS